MERKWLLTMIGREVLCGCGEGPKWPILLNREKTKGKKEYNYEVPNVENCNNCNYDWLAVFVILAHGRPLERGHVPPWKVCEPQKSVFFFF